MSVQLAFNLDADEVVTARLKSEIRALFAEGGCPECDAYAMRIVDILPHENEPRRFAYCHHYIRLYHREAARFSPSAVHDVVILRQGTDAGRLNGRIHHHSVRSTGDQIAKFNRYTDEQVLEMELRSSTMPTWRLFTEFHMAFLKAFFGRRHCTRGAYGYVTAMNYAIFRYLRVAKHYERRRILRP
ncbi:MAG: hypothetical protein ABJB01_07150 [Rudaea sp.]